MQHSIAMQAIPGLPDIQRGDDLAQLLIEMADRGSIALENGDILAIAHKVISKAEGQLIRLSEVTPSPEALDLAGRMNKDPRKVEVILRDSKRIVRAFKHPGQQEGVIIAEHRLGFICANAAVDESNVEGEDIVVVLPDDPDASARHLRDRLFDLTGARLGIVVTDTFGRPWRMGIVNVAIGLAGVPSLLNLVGKTDAYGRVMTATVPAIADEIAAASGILMVKEAKQPAILFKGISWIEEDSTAQDILRPQQEDLFR